MHDNGVIGGLHDIIGTVSRGSEAKLLGNDVAELLLQHVQEQLVERHVGTVSQSTKLLHVVREDSGLEQSISVRRTHVSLHEVIEPLLSLLGVVEGDQLLLHSIVVRNMVLDELGSLFSKLEYDR